MAEDPTTVAAASVLPGAEVDIGKTEVVAPAAAKGTELASTTDEAEADKPSNEEEKQDTSATNGDATPATTTQESAVAEPGVKADGEDTEMKDVDGAGDVATNETEPAPASAKKTPNGSAKKKSNAVPEHKSKKLNKKKSKPVLRLDAQPGELYLARMKGHQPWPSIICDEEMLPSSLLTSRPVTTPMADGTFKRPDYAPGGKRENERTFPIMFLYTNEFAWLPNTELTPLTPDECKEAPEKGKSKGLIEAYKVAADGNDLAHYKSVLLDHQKAIDEDQERRQERDAKKADKANKAKRKSEANVADDDDVEVDNEDEDAKPKSKKRKKSLDNEEGEEKPAKTPKTGAKIKLTAPKTPTAETASSKKKTPKSKPTGKKGAKALASDDEAETPKVVEKILTPAEAMEKKEKEIKYYRHKLQKGFITRDYTPGDDEIKSMSTYLQKLESYPDLEGNIIRATKINKVLKAMIKLDTIPKDEEFNFKKRSQDLLAKWNLILNSDTTDAGKEGEKEDDKEDTKEEPKSETNGVKSAEDLPTPEKGEDSDNADKPEDATTSATKELPAALKTQIGSGVEGEKEAEENVAEPSKTNEDVEMKSDEPAKADEPNVDKPTEGYVAPAETAEATA